jgi:hypothetical protein
MIGAILAAALAAGGGCTKDTDCKGDRICEAGKCVSPPPAAAPAVAAPVETSDAGVTFSAPPPPPPLPAAVNAADYPKVIRKNGVTCVQSLGDDGVVREDCRADSTSYSGNRHPMDPSSPPPSSSFAPAAHSAEDEPERSSVLADFAAVGNLGLLIGNGVGVTGGFGLHVSVAGRVSDTAAVGGMLDGQFYFVGGFLLIATLAPAIRLGEVGHATLGLGPSIVYVSSGYVSGTVLMGTFVVHGGFPLAGAFGLHPRLSISFNGGGALIGLGFGFGGSVF